MSTSDKIDIILMIELVNNVTTEKVTGTTRADTPTVDIIRVAPHQIAHGAIVGHFLLAVQTTDLVQSVDGWREASMHTEYLIVYNGCQCEVIKYLSAIAPNVDRTVLSQALIVEAIANTLNW